MNQAQLQVEPARMNGFRWMEADAYLFDIDGTLLVTRDLVHRNALHRAMREVYGVDTTIDGIAYHGKTDLGILRVALERMGISGDTFHAKLPGALEIVRSDVTANANRIVANVCSAIPDVLAKLRAAGKLLAVSSGNLESVGWQKLEAARLRRFFSFGCFSDHCEMRVDVFRNGVAEAHRRLGENAVICFIGDTPADIDAARRVGAWIVAVGTGIYKTNELARHEPDACVGSCAELLRAES
jgi:phosphoglycolate phosphatase